MAGRGTPHAPGPPSDARVRDTARLTVSVGERRRERKTSERVAREIVRDIVASGSGTGDSLAPEAVMIEQYGVGRESLREALRVLEVQGLITIRRGPAGGPVVGTVDPANLGRVSTLYYHLAGATYRELFDAWATAEAVLADRAATNPRAGSRRAAMRSYVAVDPVDAGDDPVAFERYHTRFHAVVADLALNQVLALSLQAMGRIVAHHAVLTDDPTRLRSLIETDHRRIAVCVTAGDADGARQAMDDHVRGIGRVLARRLGTRADDPIDWR